MRTISKWFLGGAVVFALVAVLWGPVVVPQLTKYPTGVDTRIQYTGTFTSYVDRATGATLAQPVTAPLTVDRHLQSVNGQYGARRAVVHETIDVTVAGKVIEHQDHQYVLDRKTMKNVDDPRAYAFVPSNKVDRAGTYTIQFPMNVKVDAARFEQWTNQTSGIYYLSKATGTTKTKVDGLGVVRLAGNQPPTAVSPFYAQELRAQGLPPSLSPAPFQATLKAKGIDVQQAITGLSALLTPDELRTVQTVFSSPIPLNYAFFDGGEAAIEPKTGAPVSVTGAREGVVVVPDLSGLAALQPIFAKYASVPAVAATAASLTKVTTAPPQTIFEMQFSQTPATIASVVKDVKSQVTKLQWARTYVRLILAGVALALLGAALATWRPRRRPGEAVAAKPVPAPQYRGQVPPKAA